MKNKRKRENWESAKMNNNTFIQYYNRLTELAISMFDWQNLPDEIDPRFMELMLFSDGMIVFFKDEELDKYLCLQTMIGGQLDVYRIPKQRTAYATNGYNRQLDDSNSVIIWNNYLHTNSMLDIEMYAKRLYNIERTIDVNINAQKTPVLITCEENERLSMKNLYMQYDGNEPYIFGESGLNPNSIKVLRTDAPFVADQLQSIKYQIWNEALTYLGINNINVSKKERMISDEVIRNQGGIIASRYSRLEVRRQACEQINKMFGLNISVDYREDYREADDEIMIDGDTGKDTLNTMVDDLRTQTVIGGRK